MAKKNKYDPNDVPRCARERADGTRVLLPRGYTPARNPEGSEATDCWVVSSGHPFRDP